MGIVMGTLGWSEPNRVRRSVHVKGRHLEAVKVKQAKLLEAFREPAAQANAAD